MRQILVFSTLLILSACSEPAKLTVSDASIRLPAVSGGPSAAYFTVKGGAKSDRLMTVTSPSVGRAEMHDTVTKDGMMSMVSLDAGVDIPVGGEIAFKPRGKHVMLFDMEPKAALASSITLTFTFSSGATLDAPAKVLKAGSGEGHAH
jgi:periplasmic copper chaperone A